MNKTQAVRHMLRASQHEAHRKNDAHGCLFALLLCVLMWGVIFGVLALVMRGCGS